MGGIVGLAIIVFALLWLHRRRRKQKMAAAAAAAAAADAEDRAEAWNKPQIQELSHDASTAVGLKELPSMLFSLQNPQDVLTTPLLQQTGHQRCCLLRLRTTTLRSFRMVNGRLSRRVTSPMSHERNHSIYLMSFPAVRPAWRWIRRLNEYRQRGNH